MRNSRVWVVSELYYPEQTSTGYFLTKFAEGLTSWFDVHVLCAQPTYSARGQRAPARETRNGVEITRCWATTLDKDNLAFRAINMLTITLSVFLQALRSFRPGDAALVVTNPPLLPLVIALAARLKGARMMLLVHDVYPESLVASGLVRADSWLARAIERVNCWIYAQAHPVIAIGRDMAELIRAKMNARGCPVEIRIVPNWADADEVAATPAAENAVLRRRALTEQFVVLYAGNLGRTHGLHTIVQAAELLRDDPAVHFLVMGWGARRAWLESTVQQRALSNVTLLPSCARDELSDHLGACNLALMTFARGMAGASVPSRMYNQMAAGRPLLASADRHSELALVVREEEIGWVVPPEDPERLVAAILEARRDPERLRAMGERARRAAEQTYTFMRSLELLTEVIQPKTVVAAAA